MNEIVVSPVMDANGHRDQINAIQHVLKEVMIVGKHYGKIPGCGDKPTLLKPGAEKIMATFGIRPEIRVEEFATLDKHIRFRVTVRALSHTGDFLGEGIGECSTGEEKYAWEKAVCEQHYDDTPATERRMKWRRGNTPRQEAQVRTSPADKANTVLKMAKKRALVDMVLTVTAASDIFDQDLDDAPPCGSAPDPIAKPQRTEKATTKPAPAPEANGSPQEVGIIEQVSEKTGTGAKGPWTRYGVLVGGEWHSTFDSEIGEHAQRIHDAGSIAVIVYSADNYGRSIVTLGESG